MLDIEDSATLIDYLRRTNRIAGDENLDVQVLAGGVSNRTVLVRPARGDAFVLKQALEKLRVNVDWYSSPERIHREALGIRWLAELAPPGSIPSLCFEDRELHLLAMSAVPLPHDNWKTLLLAGQIDPKHIHEFGQLLGTIHRNASTRRDELARVFEDRTFFESLRIEPYYAYTAEQVADSADFYARLIAETRKRRLTVVHGDYSPKNILVYHGRLVLLDHEVIHFGDPAFDVGFSLTHLLSKAHHLANLRGPFAAASWEYWQAYATTLGDVPWKDGLEARCVRHAVGCLLARVRGRSTLEYLDEGERNSQAAAALALMRTPLGTIRELVDRFLLHLEKRT